MDLGSTNELSYFINGRRRGEREITVDQSELEKFVDGSDGVHSDVE